jgi:DGQHR domain-containing protein
MTIDGSDPILNPILSDPTSLASEYRKRRNDYETKAVSRKRVEEYLEKGWIHDRKLKTKVRLKKLKGFDERLENRAWCLFYKMGYPEMNKGRNFKIKFKRKNLPDGEKQIDVFAKDDETVIIAECKASKELRQRQLQKDIESFANSKRYIANSIKKYYGNEFKPKILWLFITDKVIWSRPDTDRAKAENIRIITEREFRYFKQIVDHLGPASRYQFLAEFFENQSIPELKNTTVPAIRGKLGGKPFYCFVTTPRQLLKISFVNHRALDDPQGYPTYQRLIQKSRLKKIGKFLESGGFFPTNFLINFDRKLRFDVSLKDEENDIHFGHLYLPDKYKSAWIIDGQHRLYGYSGIDEKFLKQNIMVLAFQKLPRTEEAELFVTINHEQKSVPRNLLDDLEGDLKWGSDKPNERIGAIGARLIQLLNSSIGEPFYNKVTAQGIRATEQTCLTVPEIKDGIKRSGLIGRSILKHKVFEPGPLSDENDEKTLIRAKEALNLYFSLIQDANPDRWDQGRIGYLCTNVSVRGYLMLLAELIRFMERKKKLDSKELSEIDLISEIEEYLKPILNYIEETNDSEFQDEFKVQYGSGGPVQYFYRLCRLVRDENADFEPEGYSDWEESQSEEQILLADQRMKDLTSEIADYIFAIFKRLHGDEAYLDLGVRDIDLRMKAIRKQQEDHREKRLPVEAYFELIELKKIVEKKYNWPHFRNVFNIPIPEKKGLQKNLAWMDRLNELRRISAHPYQRSYSVDDFHFIEWIYKEFIRKKNEAETEIIEQEEIQSDNAIKTKNEIEVL